MSALLKPEPERHSILIVDDNEDQLTLQRLVLELNGFDVYTSQSGAHALKTLSHIPTPSLILLDHHLNDMTGSDLLGTLETEMPEISRSVPVVFLSGENDIPRKPEIGFIRKPFDIITLLNTVREKLGIKCSSKMLP